MKVIALIVYLIIQIAFIPLTIIGLILLSYRQLVISKRLGVSATAISAIGYRWIMDIFNIRKDKESVALYRVLPNGSILGLWLVFLPVYLRYMLGGRYKGFPFIAEEGKEGVMDVPSSRTLFFDRLINRAKGEAGQFVVMGAGYDTRCYGYLKNSHLKFFELDQAKTQKLKKECLEKAGIDASAVTFTDVDFSSEKWYDKLAGAGYDSRKKTIFLWEGVTVYLSENDVRKTLREIKEHAAGGSKILMDVYSSRVLSFRGTKSTNEEFVFGLDFSTDALTTLKTFIESNQLYLLDHYFMGHKTKKGSLGVVVEAGV